ncbi:MAG: hypothetical protein ACRC1Z_00965 [Waterburya sp.]
MVMCSVVFTILTGVFLLWVLCLNPTYKIGDRSCAYLTDRYIIRSCCLI